MEVEDQYQGVMTIAKIGCAFILGMILLSGLSVGGTGDTKSITLTLTQNPSDGETFTLDDNVFEFDSGDGVASGNIAVTIETTLSATSENFKAAIQAAGYGVAEHVQ